MGSLDNMDFEESIVNSLEGSFEVLPQKVDNAASAQFTTEPSPCSFAQSRIRRKYVESTEIVCDDTLVTKTPNLASVGARDTVRHEVLETECFDENSFEEDVCENDSQTELEATRYTDRYSKEGCNKIHTYYLHETIPVDDHTLEQGFAAEAPSGYSTPKRTSNLVLSEYGDQLQAPSPTVKSHPNYQANSSSTLENIARLRNYGPMQPPTRPKSTHYSGAISASLECGERSEGTSRELCSGSSNIYVGGLSLFKKIPVKQTKPILASSTAKAADEESLTKKLEGLIEDLKIQQNRLEDIQRDPAMARLLNAKPSIPPGSSQSGYVAQPESWFN